MRRLALVVVCSGCVGSLVTEAGSQFGAHFSCPTAQVTSVRRDDIPPHLLIPAPPPPLEIARDPNLVRVWRSGAMAPAEVASDPERLQIWMEARRSAERDEDRGHIVVEVHGCNREQFYVCGTNQDYDNGNWGCVDNTAR